MNNIPTTTHQLFTLLEGIWKGEGRGQYPSITSFDYHETLAFTRRDENSLAYEQRTQKRIDGQTEYLVSHWENGFIRLLENGGLELVDAQSGGRGEVLVGVIETQGSLTRIRFASKAIVNDPRMVASARMFEVEGDSLRYEMEMQTISVERSMSHLKGELRKSRVSLVCLHEVHKASRTGVCLLYNYFHEQAGYPLDSTFQPLWESPCAIAGGCNIGA